MTATRPHLPSVAALLALPARGGCSGGDPLAAGTRQSGWASPKSGWARA
jgi:hypothetical protein